jgi:thiol-disulfide isomerase/thioredoxin
MNSTTPEGASPGMAPQPAAGKPSGLGFPARLAFAALVVCALAALFWPRSPDETLKEPGGFLLDSGGRPAKLGPQLAPVTLVHFWATWCPPCLQEIPALQRLAKDFATHRDFTIVMVAVSDSTTKVRALLGPAGADMVLYDPKWDVAHRYGTSQLPETYLVMRGQVVEKFVGQTDWDNPELRQKLASRFAAAPERAAALAPARR